MCAHMTSANGQSLAVRGAWQAVIDPNPAYLDGINVLQGWDQQAFTLQLNWPTGVAASSQMGDYPMNPEGYSKAWVWNLTGPGNLGTQARLTVGGASAMNFSSPLTYVQVTDNWLYDGAQGLLNAGTYDVLVLSGISATCPSTGPAYWGECVQSDDHPGFYRYSVSLYGADHVFATRDEPPSLALVGSAPWLLVFAQVDRYVQGNVFAGSVDYRNPLGPQPSHTLQVSVVPEPSSWAVLLAGLLVLSGMKRRVAGQMAHPRKAR